MITKDIGKDLWAKMFYNCSLNALGAVLQVPYGNLYDNENSRIIIEKIIEEAFQVMRGLGYDSHWSNAKEYLKYFYNQLLPSTCEHESSMLQDIRLGNKTEIDSLNGVIVREGEKLGIDVFCNAVLRSQILFLQNKHSI